MKQSEKDNILKMIYMCSSKNIVAYNENYSLINTTELSKYFERLPVEPEEITEVYAIKENKTGEVVWNAHGCPYKNKSDVDKKINQLQHLLQNKDKKYEVLTFKLENK